MMIGNRLRVGCPTFSGSPLSVESAAPDDYASWIAYCQECDRASTFRKIDPSTLDLAAPNLLCLRMVKLGTVLLASARRA
jgi:hypothetical protein